MSIIEYFLRYNNRNIPIYMLFSFIEGEDDSSLFFDGIEKTLRITSDKSLQKNWEERSWEIFSSTESIHELSSKCGGFFGDIDTLKNVFAIHGTEIRLEKIKEDNKNRRCDYRTIQPPILIESKSKLPGYGCKGNESIINDFFINHVFRLNFFSIIYVQNFARLMKQK